LDGEHGGDDGVLAGTPLQAGDGEAAGDGQNPEQAGDGGGAQCEPDRRTAYAVEVPVPI
jgi:hypothetical protein